MKWQQGEDAIHGSREDREASIERSKRNKAEERNKRKKPAIRLDVCFFVSLNQWNVYNGFLNIVVIFLVHRCLVARKPEKQLLAIFGLLFILLLIDQAAIRTYFSRHLELLMFLY
jgi:hypothetical protein